MHRRVQVPVPRRRRDPPHADRRGAQALTPPPARPPEAAAEGWPSGRDQPRPLRMEAQGWPSGRDQPLPGGAGGDVLDDPAAMAEVDPTDFLRTVEELPAQLQDAAGLARS